jgi:DNA polymerase III sliding clamp (beta) subunit (PCNA family)
LVRYQSTTSGLFTGSLAVQFHASTATSTTTINERKNMKEIVLPVMALKEALPGLNKVVSKRSTLPVLQHVRLARNTEGIISIQATDLDAFATYTAKEPSPGPAVDMLMPLDQLAKTVKSLSSEGTIGFVLDSKDKVKVRYSIGGSLVERTISTLATDDFPAQPTITQPAMPLEPGFGLALRQALECCSEDSSRYILRGACLDVRDKKFHYIVGTNGRSLYSANSFCFDLKKPVVIPDSKFLEWPDLLDDEAASLSVEPGQEEEPAKDGKPAKEATAGWIKLESGRWTFITKEILGEFPNWKQVLPSTNSKWTRVQLSDEAIRQLLLVTPSLPGDDGINRPVRLRVEPQQIALEGQNKDDETWTTVPIQAVKVTGKPVTVTLNRTYFTTALKFGLNQMEVEDPLSAVVFSNGGKKMIIMPVNLDGPKVTVTPAQANSEATPATSPTAEQTASQDQPGTPTERTEMPRTARATTPEPMTTFHPETHANNNGNGNGNGSAVKSLVEHVEQIKENLKGIIRDLNTVIDTVKATEKERKSSEKEIENVRTKLRQIQSVAI